MTRRQLSDWAFTTFVVAVLTFAASVGFGAVPGMVGSGAAIVLSFTVGVITRRPVTENDDGYDEEVPY